MKIFTSILTSNKSRKFIKGGVIPKVSKITSNKVLNYTISTYLIYVLYFVNSIFIAIYLGPYYLGVWGFINLVIQYLAQLNFGITHSVNSIVSISKDDKDYITRILGISLTLLSLLSIFLLFFFLFSVVFNFDIGNKFHFYNYLPLVLIVAILAFYNSLISNVYRAYGKLNEIIFNQIFYPLISLLCIFFYRGVDLLWALVISNAISSIIIFIVLIVRCPISIRPNLDMNLAKMVVKRGLYLFLYNTSFYLIIITTRSFVSAYFLVTEFGYFTFAFTLANAVLLLLQSFSFLIYPKLLNRFSKFSNEQSYLLLKEVRSAYLTVSHFIIHFAILLVPVFLLFFPKYESAQKAYPIIALTVVLFSNSFGYQELLISKSNEKKLGFLAFCCLGLNLVLCYIMIKVFNVPYYLLSIGTMITYMVYVFFVGKSGIRLLDLDSNFKTIIKDIYPARIMIPYFISILIFFTYNESIYLIIPIVVFLILNYKTILGFKKIIKLILFKPDIINI
ncbi:oligosaccharide flippase family protein [Flavobacterium sp. LC2016-23]|uniref:lipopolysaccharide biosynthesis protein n=1 Tax=Flavobacterium sp. LC2016-23 TaxID=2666330 RepID=UPI0012AF7BAA